MAKSRKYIKYRNDATCIGNHRGMAKRAKTKSNKTDRQQLLKELKERENENR